MGVSEENKKEIIDELRECIIDYVNDIDHQRYDKARELYHQLEHLTDNIFESNGKVLKRCSDIEYMITQHAIGVQSVYEEVTKLKDLFNSHKYDRDAVIDNLESRLNGLLDTIEIQVVKRKLKKLK